MEKLLRSGQYNCSRNSATQDPCRRSAVLYRSPHLPAEREGER